MSKFKSELEEKLETLRLELKKVTKEIEVSRNEDQEEDVAISRDLLDKKAIIIRQLNEIEIDLSDTYGRGKSIRPNITEVEIGNSVFLNIKGSTKIITIVTPIQADPGKGYISTKSPLGTALIGKKKGDKVLLETPAGNLSYVILKIE